MAHAGFTFHKVDCKTSSTYGFLLRAACRALFVQPCLLSACLSVDGYLWDLTLHTGLPADLTVYIHTTTLVISEFSIDHIQADLQGFHYRKLYVGLQLHFVFSAGV